MRCPWARLLLARCGPYTGPMLFAQVWHFWLAVPIAVGAIIAVVSVLGLYVTRVTKTRYPNSDA